MATLDTTTDDQVSPGAPSLDWKAVGAVALGNMLEFYDFITYTFFAKSISADAFFPVERPDGEPAGIAGGLLGRASSCGRSAAS